MSKIITLFYHQVMDRPQQNITLSKVRIQDILPCALIYAQGFKRSYKYALELITDLITDPQLQVVVALDCNEEVIAMCVLAVDDTNNVYFSDYVIDPTYLNQGLGTTILKQLIWQVQQFHNEVIFVLKVRDHNYPAIKLYNKIGFVESIATPKRKKLCNA